METKQIINWLRDKAARAEELSWQRMLKTAADRLDELDVDDINVGNKTNGDVIRTMSDEKLAEFLSYACPCPTENCRPSCVNCIGNWLKQPAEVE